MASETPRATRAEPAARAKSDKAAPTRRDESPATTAADAAAPEPAAAPGRRGFAALTLGAVGVVFGDIGTSPLYAMREALRHARAAESPELAVLGVVSLVVWTLTLIVTVKYIIFLMRADNRGEGGTLALMSLAQRAVGRRTATIFILGAAGAALFYGEGVITPAISVLSAVEGVRGAPDIGHTLAPHVVPIAAGILVALFLVQARGTHRVAALFGPITVVWFLTLAGLGAYHLNDDLSVLRGLNPYYGAQFLIDNRVLGFVILGSVFLAVTGAEALYADMGHFGRGPIRTAWFVLVFPCLVLNYLGQGAVVLHHPIARSNPFWAMTPEVAYWPVLILATLATVIASQAMISGAFSMTQQAVQLGLLPRIEIRRTSETLAGQIFVPSVNLFLMLGVLLLLLVFRSSSRLAAAYGAAVTGAMLIDTLLAYFVVRRMWKWNLVQTACLLVPIILVDLIFTLSNLLKIPTGAWLPLVLGAGLMVIMATWTRGTHILFEKTRRDSLPLKDLIGMLHARPPYRAPGTAIFLTSDPDMTPVALMHNLKHNKMLHEKNIILTVQTMETPVVPAAERITIEPIDDDFKKVRIAYGFMESPNLPRALQQCKKQGLKFDIMSTSFFLGRRSLVAAARSGMPGWQDKLFIFLMKNAANPTEFFKIPPGRVVELGAQLTV
ncbi:MAG: potassium transporter Kup [Caulobacteraceae bacterium]|nr:potassium transporter Kup [Caulobacteraceae bacterium]